MKSPKTQTSAFKRRFLLVCEMFNHEYNKTLMKITRSQLNNAFFAILLVVLGLVIENRYGLVYSFARENPQVPIISTRRARSLVTNEEIPPERQQEVSFETFWEVWSLLERDYLEPGDIKAEKMVNGAIGGMTSALGDPYTVYLPPAENQRSGEDLAGSFFGVGIELGYREGILAVVAPLKDTPAEQAGIKAGDLIIRVNDPAKNLDEDSSRWSLNEAVDAIRGPKGTPVTLTLLREGQSEPLEITVNRGEIVVNSVEVEFVEHAGKRVAHVSLSRFGERTEAEWDEVVSTILKNKPNINGIVLDMRNNPGGFFDGAIDIASDLIQSGVVVTQKGQFVEQDFPARGRARLINIPVEVLVNRGSASASEIVAGALRDRLGAKLIGERTFGKGTVQDRRELSNGGGLHVTIARWLLPSGEWIHDEGIPVNIEIADNPDTEEDEQLLRAIEEL
jgi:carboxyl-terminal processing protease